MYNISLLVGVIGKNFKKTKQFAHYVNNADTHQVFQANSHSCLFFVSSLCLLKQQMIILTLLNKQDNICKHETRGL